MIVCSCYKVSDHDIRDAVGNGAASLKALRMETGLGSNCGSCLKVAKSLMNDHLSDMCEANPDLYYAA